MQLLVQNKRRFSIYADNSRAILGFHVTLAIAGQVSTSKKAGIFTTHHATRV
jgi:hypothetical protein